MFQHEARILASLTHPHIPQIHDFGMLQRYWFMILEYAPGWNLSEVQGKAHHAGLKLPTFAALTIVYQLALAIYHAHERKDALGRPLHIVHRDLAPHNVMLSHEGVIKLLDFGVAHSRLNEDEEPGTIKGTFGYMSPEQVRGEPLDARSDVFVLGILLYEFATGQRLFSSDHVKAATQIAEGRVTLPSEAVEGFDPQLESLILHALTAERKMRIPSADHFAELLENYALRQGFSLSPRSLSRAVRQLARDLELEVVADINTTEPFHVPHGRLLSGVRDLAAQPQQGPWNKKVEFDALSQDLGEQAHAQPESTRLLETEIDEFLAGLDELGMSSSMTSVKNLHRIDEKFVELPVLQDDEPLVDESLWDANPEAVQEIKIAVGEDEEC